MIALSLCLGLLAPNNDYVAGEVTTQGVSIPYQLLTPDKVKKGERYPLVLFLHGAGERGNDNEGQKRHFPERMATDAYRKDFGAFVLAPQCPQRIRWANTDYGNPVWNPERLPTLEGAILALREVVREHPIDTDRIYLTGLSMGGYGTFELAAHHPDWFAAAAAVCGGVDPVVAPRYAGLPFEIWHGDADGVIPAKRSQVIVEAMKSLELEVHYVELPGVRHDSWVQAYGPEGCLERLFAQKRDPVAMQEETARLLGEALGKKRVAFLGDSITQAGNNPGGYVDRIRKGAPDLEIVPAGISGHKVPNLLARYEKDVLAKKPDYVFIYIGINDVWHSKNGRGTPIEEYGAGLRELVKGCQKAGAKVVLATPTVIGECSVNDLDEMLEEYAAVSREVAEELGAELCDLRKVFRSRLAVFNPTEANSGILTTDGVHLNAEGNLLVAIEAARALRLASER